MDEKNTIGAKIRARRRLLDMTQEQLGALLGVEQSTVAAYEKASDMKYATLARIAAGLRCTPADLLPESQEQAQ